MTEHRVSVDGVRLGVVQSGEGSPVLALHGFTGDASTLSEVVEGLDRFARVVCVDLVGHGRSDAPADVRDYSMEACVRQILGVVDALALERPHLVGYSMGGRTALAAAAHPASPFQSLTLVGATAGIAEPTARADRVRADEALADRIEREGIEAFVEHWMALPLFASQKRLGDEKLRAARAQRLRNRPYGLARSLRGMGAGAQPPIFERLAAVKIPALLVAGAEDPKFCGVARDLESRLPNARSAILPEAGHAAHLEAPEAFRALFFDFLCEVDAEMRRARDRVRERGGE